MSLTQLMVLMGCFVLGGECSYYVTKVLLHPHGAGSYVVSMFLGGILVTVMCGKIASVWTYRFLKTGAGFRLRLIVVACIVLFFALLMGSTLRGLK
jgi:hypothetical protein